MRNYLTSNPAILKEARDYLDGLMLGDGHIECVSNDTGRYTQSCKENNWIDKISEDLYEYSIVCSVDDGRFRKTNYSLNEDSIIYGLWTHRYIEFKELHDRWYKKDYNVDECSTTRWHLDENREYYIWQKIIPKDICLSPVCVANFYIGDGSIPKFKQLYKYNISLSTDGFWKKDTMFLADLMSEVLDIKCSITDAGKILISNKSDVSMFLDYIKNYKVECYNYKFPEIT